MSLLDGFLDWCPSVIIPSKEQGPIPFAPLLGTQAWMLHEIEAGLENGVHDFVQLKGGRQIGGSTLWDALTLWWLQTYSGMIGMMVSDSDDNRDYRRDVMVEMHGSLPRDSRRLVRRDNLRLLAWVSQPKVGYVGSRLLFGAAGIRKDSNIGRSKGLTYNYNDEVGSWQDAAAYSALRASRAERNPLRLYGDVSTARGRGTAFHDIWRAAEKAVTQRAVFVACWRHEGYRVLPEQTALWETYGVDGPSSDEKHWIKEVKRRYDVLLTQEFFAWYRWKLAEEFRGDEVLMAQEFGILPEECFQAFGDKFISPKAINALTRQMSRAPKGAGYRYAWGRSVTETRVEKSRGNASLHVWEEPRADAVYCVAGHPWGSSSPDAKEAVCQVWRVWSDGMRLVAQFVAGSELKMFQFAWVCVHLCAVYRTTLTPPYFALEIGGGGKQVMAELDRMESVGYGVGPLSPEDRGTFLSLIAPIQYLYRRIDSFTGTCLRQMETTPKERTRLLYQVRDEVERDHLEIYDEGTIDQLSLLRRGEEGDADQIAGGGGQEESRAFCTAMATEAWLSQAMGDLAAMVAPRNPEGLPSRVEHILVGNFLPWNAGRE